ncbi:MAG TPA: ABC transporter permease [Terracidiphilus sp.]
MSHTLATLRRELKYASRTLIRTPGFSLVSVIVIALCIAASTSLFTVVRSVLLRPLPFRDPDRLVMIFEHFRAPSENAEGFNWNVVAPADFYDWRSKTNGFEDMAIWSYGRFNLTGERNELPEVVRAGDASWNLFPLLGVEPALGRTFAQAEDQPGGNAVMLTWSVYQRRFAADPAILGHQIHLDTKPYTVVGVLPKWFTYPDAQIQIWVPFAAALPREFLDRHDYHFSRVVARLRPDVSLQSAISQVGALQYQLHLQYAPAPVAEDVAPRALNEDLATDVKKPLEMLMGAAGCMLLIGCLNVANLLVARGASRQREVAIRVALGAPRSTLIRQQLAESLLICLTGGIVGVIFSIASTRWLAQRWNDLPSAQSIRIDGGVMAFAFAVVMAAAVIAGLFPALSSTGKSVIKALLTSTRTGASSVSRTTLRKTLLTVEIAVTVVLLVTAGLLLKSFLRLHSADVGVATDNLLTLNYSLPAERYDQPEKVNAFNRALLERLRAVPGVRGVAMGLILPAAGYGGDDVFAVTEHPPLKPGEDFPDALHRTADPGYFAALGIPLRSGRFFTAGDTGDRAFKVIVSSLLAKLYFPSENPIGKHLHVVSNHDADYEIVGVVGDTLWRVDRPASATMYFPLLQGEIGARNLQALAVRTAGNPLDYSVTVQRQIAALDSTLPVSHVLTMDEVIGQSVGNASLSATLVLCFGILSLILASVGLYGVLQYLMTQRTMELGIRMALGAPRDHVLQLVLLEGMGPAFVGLIVGLIAGLLATRIFQSMLFETKPVDPMVLCGVTGTLLAVAALACFVPAWRASRLDPTKALRTE